MTAGTLAPRRPAALRRRSPGIARVGAYDVIACDDPDGPAPDPGQFYMLAAAEGWGGGGDERPFLPRAFSVLRRRDDGTLEFLLEDVGPGTRRLCALRPGDGLWILGPLGSGFAPPRDGRRPLLVGGGVGIAPLAIWSDRPRRRRARAARLPRRAARRGRGADRGRARGDRRRLGRPPRASSPTCWPPSSAPTRAPRSTPAARRRCSRRCARCAPSAACPRSSRSSRAWPAASAPASAAWSRPRSGYVRLCVDGPVLDAADLETALIPGAGH